MDCFDALLSLYGFGWHALIVLLFEGVFYSFSRLRCFGFYVLFWVLLLLSCFSECYIAQSASMIFLFSFGVLDFMFGVRGSEAVMPISFFFCLLRMFVQ